MFETAKNTEKQVQYDNCLKPFWCELFNKYERKKIGKQI